MAEKVPGDEVGEGERGQTGQDLEGIYTPDFHSNEMWNQHRFQKGDCDVS